MERVGMGRRSWGVGLILCLILAITGVLRVGKHQSIERVGFSDQQAVRAILGEARGQGYEGLYAVACALRNRGDLRGVRGYKAIMEPIDAKVSQDAVEAWFDSGLGPDITDGANHWENIESFGMPSWAKHCKETVKIGKHTFFRC